MEDASLIVYLSTSPAFKLMLHLLRTTNKITYTSSHRRMMIVVLLLQKFICQNTTLANITVMTPLETLARHTSQAAVRCHLLSPWPGRRFALLEL
jgi:hypothetical protein